MSASASSASLPVSALRNSDDATGERTYQEQDYSMDDLRMFNEQAMVEVGKDRLVGLLDHEQVFAYSQSLQLAFKKSCRFTHSSFFLKELFATNPFLRFFAMRNKDQIKLVNRLERSSKGLCHSLVADKAVAAEKVMADVALRHLYSRTEAMLARGSYTQHMKELTAALREVNAGGHAMDLILGAKSKALFSWSDSLKKNPLATLMHVLKGAYYESFEGEGGVLGHDLKKSCFSFGYRVNTIMPYAALFPGGVFGSVLKSLARSFVFVFYPAFASFRGIFTLLIGLICKTRIVVAFRKTFEALMNVTRLGLRGIRVLFRRFAVRNDPVAWPLVRDLLFSGSPKMITLLFQLYAVDVEDITKSGKRVSSALAAGSGAWNFADGLWVGATDFGQAFNEVVGTYRNRVAALVRYCEHEVSNYIDAFDDAELRGALEAIVSWALEQDIKLEKERRKLKKGDNAAEANSQFLMHCLVLQAPGSRMSEEEARRRLSRSCEKNNNFLKSYRRKPENHVRQLVLQMVKILKYDYKFFAHYIGEMLSIFYEAAHALLNADVANVIDEKLAADTLGAQIGEAVLQAHKYQEVSMELGKSAIPRRMFRDPWLKIAARNLAYGFFHSAAGFALFHATESQASAGSRSNAAFTQLKTGASQLRKGIKSLYRQFLESKIMIARLEGHKSVTTVQQFLSKCNDKLGVPDPQVCGKVLTNKIDPEAFVLDAMFSLNVRMASPTSDIALLSQTDYGHVFAKWAETKLSKKDRRLAAKASDAGMQPSQRALVSRWRLAFPRFDFAADFTQLVLYDLNGRSLIFTGRAYLLGSTKCKGHRVCGFRPSPLQTSCWFLVEHDNVGNLQFPISESARGQAQSSTAMGPAAPVTGLPVHVVHGRITYRNSREELRSIKNDPSAVRDVMVARFVYTQGRAAAELLASVLFLIHSKSPSFREHSPAVFLQNIAPKMFFDAFHALAVTSQTRGSTGVMLEGRLYTFPFNFSTMKALLLGAVNRMIQRLHSLDSKDMVSVFLITVAVMAYHKIQKHRTGKTLVMNMYLRDTLHLREIERLGRFEEEAPYCGWMRQHSQSTEELIVKCSAYRFLRMGDLNETEPLSAKIRDYLDAFHDILNDVRGSTPWWDFLNVQTFLTEADVYAKTTAKYSYLDLEDGLRAEQARRGDESLISAIHSDFHPALGGPQPYVKDSKDLVTALRSFAENIKKLPGSLRKKIPNYINSCLGKLRRLVGAKQFKWMQTIRPNVLHASTFYAAIQAAESLVFPSPYMERGIFIDVLDLIEYGRLQLSFEELAVTLSSSRAMHTIAGELRTMPVQTAEAREAYEKLKNKVDALPLRTVEAAAGWSLRFLGEGQGGMDQALGLLALKGTEPEQITKALRLTYASVEVLNFLITALDVAEVLEFLGEATQEDLKKLRIKMQTFSATLQTEARSFGLNIKSKFSLTRSLENVTFVLEHLRVPVSCSSALLTAVPPAFVRGSFDSDNTTEPAALCYFFLELSKRLSQREETLIPEALLRNLVVDGTSVKRFLEQIVDTSLPAEVRLGSIKKITVMLRALLITCSTHQLGTIGAAQFTAFDLKTGIMTFFFANAVELQTGGPSGLKPAELFSQVARVVYGVEGLEEQPQGSRIVSASVSYPHSLEDWASYLDQDKLGELMNGVRQGTQQLTGEALALVSASTRMADITDALFGMRLASPVDPRQILAEITKIDCLQKAMDNIETYIPYSLVERHLFNYDCFVKKLPENMALIGVARTSTDAFVEQLIGHIHNAYSLKAGELLQALRSKPDRLAGAVQKGGLFLKQVPNLPLAYPVVREVIVAIMGGAPWEELLSSLRQLQQMDWAMPEPKPSRKRLLDSFTRPNFFNPFQIAADFIGFLLTGVYERPRMPKMLLFKRIKARAKMSWKRLHRNNYEDTARDAIAQRLAEEVSAVETLAGWAQEGQQPEEPEASVGEGSPEETATSVSMPVEEGEGESIPGGELVEEGPRSAEEPKKESLLGEGVQPKPFVGEEAEEAPLAGSESEGSTLAESEDEFFDAIEA
ncbi:hypothetical protein Esti_000812 [Eimeria stiedai]